VSLEKLSALEDRLNKTIGGRERFTEGSIWNGRRQLTKDVYEMHLTVKNCTGDSFTGVLSQNGNYGLPDLMKIEGKLDGNMIAFHTSGMIRGANRNLGFKGYLLSNRIITSVEGTAANGKSAAGGWMNLWRDANPPKK
jgi:hypothetical protein